MSFFEGPPTEGQVKMTNGNGPPSLTEIARRVQRVEALLDERIVTRDMLAANDKLAEARELSHAATTQALEKRVDKLESANSKLLLGLISAFLLFLVSIITQLIQAAGGPR